MADVLPYKRVQAAEAASFSEEARSLGKRVFSARTLAAAQATVLRLMAVSGGSPLGEAASDVRALRGGSEYVSSLALDLYPSDVALRQLMLDAMARGYESEGRNQAKAVKGLTVTVTDQDRRDMEDYPIQGHRIFEISRHMHEAVRYEADGLLAGPLVGDANPNTVSLLLGDLATRFGDRCAVAVGEAYYSGVQMAMRAVASAIGVV